MFLCALVVVVLRESREDILIMQELFNSEMERINLKWLQFLTSAADLC